MFKIYEAGSKHWEQIGSLTSKEKVDLMKDMEASAAKNRKLFPDEYFYWLIVSFEEHKMDAGTFREFKRCNYYIQKLAWLRHRNYSLEYKQKINAVLEALTGQVPAAQLDELRDCYEELTVLT